MKTNTKHIITQSLRWSVFIMSALTMSIKIAEVSAAYSLELIIANPEIASYSAIVTHGLLIIK